MSTGRTTTASYYLSTNSSITTTDTLLGNRTTNTLLPGQSHSSSQLVTIPGNTATRSCWLGVIADRLRQVAEVSETNNTRALLRSCRALPDLIVSRLVPNTTTWRPNAIIQIDSTIRNDGAVTTGRTTTATAYLSSQRAEPNWQRAESFIWLARLMHARQQSRLVRHREDRDVD